jgi:hypothetical protein
VVPLHPAVVALLRPHKAACRRPSGCGSATSWAGTNNLVFMTKLGRPVDPRNLLGS